MSKAEQHLISDEMSQVIVSTAERLVLSEGVSNITVRKILCELGITNRVFYNRFHNIDDVLNVVYINTILKIRESVSGIDPNEDFFTQVIGIVAATLTMSYETKMNFSGYVFANDSVSARNFEWWNGEILRIIEYGIHHGHFKKELNKESMAYAIWCFIRGYNADAIARGVPKQKAVEDFKYSFGILLDGMKA